MILRWLWLLLFIAVLWFVRRVLLSMRDEPGRVSGARRGGEPRAETMVRDRVCNTFLPRSQAIIERDARGEHFFCSEACRRKFLSGADAPKA